MNEVKIIEILEQSSNVPQPYILDMKSLGKGSYGSVYKAIHRDNPYKRFAVKVIQLNKQTKTQILKQLQIIKNIPKSPNIVETLKEHLQSDNNVYIFQQYCEGGNLKDYRQRRHNSLIKQSQAYDLFTQLGNGLIDLHSAGISHEDIKPANILIKKKNFKYCDFGVSELASTFKCSNSRRGTVSYMPPQKLRKNFIPKFSSDIYSLGVTLYQVIFNRHPYLEKKTKDIKQYIGLIKNAQLPLHRQLLKKIYNPSLIFQRFLYFLDSMVHLNVHHRANQQQLKDFIQFLQPYRMSQSCGPIVQNSTQYQQLNAHYNIIGQSKIMFKSNFSSQLNQLINNESQKFSVEVDRSDNLQKVELLKRKKAKQNQQIRQSIVFNLTVRHKFIQSLISYLNDGRKNCISVLQENPKLYECGAQHFADLFVQNSTCKQMIKSQNVINVLNIIGLKFNALLMNQFKQVILNLSKQTDQSENFNFYFLINQLQVNSEISFLQAEFSKFIADQNIKDLQLKKNLIDQIRQWNPSTYCSSLANQFSKLFNVMVKQNFIKINFKNSLLNAIFLLHVSNILNQVNVILTNPELFMKNIKSVSTFSQQISQSVQQVNFKILNFNFYRNLKIKQLNNKFTLQFQSISQSLSYDAEEDTDEWTNLDFSQIMQQLQDEQK